ncbi:protein kinase/lanthionine synthetase C family protein [Chitinophaga barathri]|uniref:Protein kinase domain-containing protein n=1 Tax=Chitinophaga barathri TaxID=1647451 RepID=A0A3N4MDN1_9BACT|nr:protein kinase/lanthionine synthetase C family protein [Chitinophaga barathri]RPD41851.1 hypothetical protein EG028_06715 [Chitinophaga barathri]
MAAEQSVSLHEGSVAVIPQKAEKKSGKRIGYYYIILKSLKESKKNDVVKCIYIKGLTNFGLCVIKEGSQGDTKDKYGRDIQDRLKWQRELHERLAGKVRMPKLLGSFQENGNYYLVMEYIKGKPLQSIIRKDHELRQSLLDGNNSGMRMLEYLEQIVRILEVLHHNDVVHRDVTVNNFMIMPNGKVAVIDMELSYSISGHYPDPPFTLGTYGYMSPEQERTALPTIKEDIYAIGAIMLHAWTGISPYKFSGMSEEELQRAVLFYVEEVNIASIIQQCLKKEADLRPTTDMIAKVLQQTYRDKANNIPRPLKAVQSLSSSFITETIERGIQTLGESVLADKEKGWFAEHMSQSSDQTNDIKKAWYASFNRGAAGVLYFLSRARGAGYNVSNIAVPIGQALDLIRNKYVNNFELSNRGLHFGSDGVALALAECCRWGLLTKENAIIESWSSMLSRDSDKLGLMDGLAGQGIANLHCSDMLEGTREEYIANQLINAQHPDGSWSIRQKGGAYHFANGQAGITYFLLSYGAKSGRHEAIECAERSLKYLISKAGYCPGGLTWKKISRKHFFDHSWCEGTPGMALMFLKAYEITGDTIYHQWIGEALKYHDERSIWGGLSLCHGVSGLGEVYLEAGRVLKEEHFIKRAGDCLQVVLHSRRLTAKGGAYWFVEKERKPVANIMLGNAGILHFLVRYKNVELFGFPGL